MRNIWTEILDKEIRLRIVTIVLGIVCILSLIMSTWYAWRSIPDTVPITTTQINEETQIIENSSAQSDGYTTRNELEDVETLENEDSAVSENRVLEDTSLEDMELGNAEPVTSQEELYGDLIVTNYVEAKGEELLDPEKAFHFTIHVGEEVYECALKAGESYRIEGIPVGIAYEVEEADYLAEYYVNEDRHSTGIITEGDNHEIFSSVLTPAVEVEQMLEEALAEYFENEEDIANTEEELKAIQEQELEDIVGNIGEQEDLHYVGEVSLSKEARPMLTVFWVVMLMSSIVALKVIIVTPWLKKSF